MSNFDVFCRSSRQVTICNRGISRVWPLLFTPLAACATAQPELSSLAFKCGDVAVVGRIKTVGDTPHQNAGPLPNWRSKYSLQIQIKRVVRGVECRRTVQATALAHAQIRDDRDFLIVLTPDGAGGYSLATAFLWQDRPKLDGACS